MNKFVLLTRILVVPIAVALVFAVYGIVKKEKLASTVRAVGDLLIDFRTVLPGDPIFTISDFKPGDCEERTVDVKNGGTVARFVSVSAIKTAPTDNQDDPYRLETIANINITNPTNLYSGSLLQFFTQSNQVNKVPLGIVNPNQTVSYNFKVCFPPEAGNEYQKKTVTFDLVFGIISSDNLVINEVYYKVDSNHGLDSPKDRGVGGTSATISGNGAGSKNLINLKVKNTCVVVQQNTTNVQGAVSGNSNTGGNSASGNTGGVTIIKTGNSSVNVNVTTIGGNNTTSCGACCSSSQNDEWIELFNPTLNDISLKNWSLTDNSNNTVKITANKTIKAGGFALISKDSSLWKYWNENTGATKVELGQQIGDGFDNKGDRIYLKNPGGEIIDYTAWGNDTAIWNPAVAEVTLGSSMERLTPGLDNNLPGDWEPRLPPTPGI